MTFIHILLSLIVFLLFMIYRSLSRILMFQAHIEDLFSPKRFAKPAEIENVMGNIEALKEQVRHRRPLIGILDSFPSRNAGFSERTAARAVGWGAFFQGGCVFERREQPRGGEIISLRADLFLRR